jgi:hypothetical protein
MILVLLAALVIAYAAPQPWPYPSHPPGVHVFADTGVLTAYDLGNHNGGLTVRHADGTSAHFFIALPNKINGRRYGCQMLPWIGEPISMRDSKCEVHPAVVIGKTPVRVLYWWSVFENRRAKISDSIWAIQK